MESNFEISDAAIFLYSFKKISENFSVQMLFRIKQSLLKAANFYFVFGTFMNRLEFMKVEMKLHVEKSLINKSYVISY